MTPSKRAIAFAAVLFATGAWSAAEFSNAKDKEPPATAESQEKPGPRKTAMKAFMRKKLAASQEVLEGLAVEDYDLIERGAKQLRDISVAAEFMVLNGPIYDEFAADFRRTVNKMEKAAKEKRIDGATLAYMDTTMNCVECHKYVRTILIAK